MEIMADRQWNRFQICRFYSSWAAARVNRRAVPRSNPRQSAATRTMPKQCAGAFHLACVARFGTISCALC
eukprot:7799941-Alexandrium_andersonii.AAC.1